MLEVKKLFIKAKEQERNLRALRDQQETLYTAITSTTSHLKDVVVQSSGSGDQMSESVPRLIELEEKIHNSIREMVMIQLEAGEIIDKIDDLSYQAILREYYINDKSLKETARLLHYDEDYIRHLNGKALMAAEEIYQKGH